ncbi:protein cholesin [Pelodytes ibericus]
MYLYTRHVTHAVYSLLCKSNKREASFSLLTLGHQRLQKPNVTLGEESPEMRDLEDLTPEERRVLERKLKKERKKEEKRLKKESEVEEKEEEPSKPSACELSLEYLKSWSQKRQNWKFQKTRQTWLLLNMYDQDKIPDEYFTVLLEYLGGLKGSARDTTVKKSEALMKEYDSAETQEESDRPKLTRIREVLQLLS